MKKHLIAASLVAALSVALASGQAASQTSAPTPAQAPASASGHDHEAMKAEMQKKMEAGGMNHEAMKAGMKTKMEAGGMDHEAMKADMKKRMATKESDAKGEHTHSSSASSGGHSHGSTAANADGKAAHEHGATSAEERSYGKPGDAKKVNRSVTIRMSDTMRFNPSVIHAKRGETIRFVVRNDGKQKHEMVIGTLDELKKHAEAMKKNPDMEHDEHDEAVEVKAGRRGTLVWQFSKAGEFDFACLIPGHFDAGMVGKVIVK